MEKRSKTRNAALVKNIDTWKKHVVAAQSQFSALAISMELPLLKLTLLTLLGHREHVVFVLTMGCNQAGKAGFPKAGLVCHDRSLVRTCSSGVAQPRYHADSGKQ